MEASFATPPAPIVPLEKKPAMKYVAPMARAGEHRQRMHTRSYEKGELTSLLRQEVEVRVVVARGQVLVLKVRRQSRDVVLAATDRLRMRLEVEEDGCVQVVVIAVAEVEVAAGARRVTLLEAAGTPSAQTEHGGV
jgi:hypothetical protein